ncbi:hypothetical protein PSECIP111854_04093 [Pseudoalteromonas sp. CIP111854]|uniref:Uncharacterized protein n=1 Tax=Pseudoalteromonas holothuriae TaxID=2963714 RepID=A0A9W4R5Q2_9GAMM|nr:hypothetical protein [Pseudoalteromonas sp. CIP111854]CAH9067387.1 hypothetical protein PSECIP111854_04093 [Pseudoalteromonas sp. CIP111854]
MEPEHLFYAATIILAIIALYNVTYILKLLYKLSIFIFAKTPSSSLKVGDYIRVQGNMRMPAIKSPFFNNICVYWRYYIYASFESKRKKPNKGMQEHNPRLDVQESHTPPFIVAQSNYLIHIAFTDISSALINLTASKNIRKKPPNEKAEQLVKDKYKAYRVHEYRLPINADVAIWGKVDSINGQMINIVHSSDDNHPSFLYAGSALAVYWRFIERILLSLAAIAACYALNFYLPVLVDKNFVFVIVSLIGIGVLQKLAKRKLFKRK